ncbi:hypothetical protein NQ318_007989 [Aromia moschata]|uniref:DDE Tnp4 domain-containing protein n=1 Tax=Aromia moschata TaxID=1265417 RepID=A0AAV8XJ91_9CUCU|nr:hypothetical protein NQ318_007989 [Aromia moschata]
MDIQSLQLLCIMLLRRKSRKIKNNRQWFFVYTRMTPTLFEHLLQLVGPHLQKHSRRESLTPEQRLAITLRFLATGDNTFSIASAYRLGRSTVSKIVNETTEVIWNILSPLVLPEPTLNKNKQIARRFGERWNFPHVIGAIDGKHIKIQAPPNSGSQYFNYKKYFSILLLGVCDADYNFTTVDVGAYGSESDGKILNDSIFGISLSEGKLEIPPSENLEGIQEKIPFFYIGDEAFPLRKEILRPYAGKKFRSPKRARRTIENTFGILVARWRIFLRTIIGKPKHVDNIIKATVCLHNFIKKANGIDHYKNDNSSSKYCPTNYCDTDDMPGKWRQEIENCTSILEKCKRLGANNPTKEGNELRDTLSRYFVSTEGFKGGQIKYVKRT